MFQVFVDSAANLPAVTAKKYDIHVVSFVNLVNGKELVCFDPDLSPEEELAKGKEYYNAMRTGCEIKTGLISTANFADAFRTALEADQDVIYLSLSKNISGTYNSARLAAEELLEEYGGKRKIRLVDSLNASLAQGILAIYASEMRDRGRSSGNLCWQNERHFHRRRSEISFPYRKNQGKCRCGRKYAENQTDSAWK